MYKAQFVVKLGREDLPQIGSQGSGKKLARERLQNGIANFVLFGSQCRHRLWYQKVIVGESNFSSLFFVLSNSDSTMSLSDTPMSASSGYGHDQCCPLVVDPLLVATLIGSILAATGFLYVAITMAQAAPRRKRSFPSPTSDLEEERPGEVREADRGKDIVNAGSFPTGFHVSKADLYRQFFFRHP